MVARSDVPDYSFVLLCSFFVRLLKSLFVRHLVQSSLHRVILYDCSTHTFHDSIKEVIADRTPQPSAGCQEW